jgi:hypothetical protein
MKNRGKIIDGMIEVGCLTVVRIDRLLSAKY